MKKRLVPSLLAFSFLFTGGVAHAEGFLNNTSEDTQSFTEEEKRTGEVSDGFYFPKTSLQNPIKNGHIVGEQFLRDSMDRSARVIEILNQKEKVDVVDIHSDDITGEKWYEVKLTRNVRVKDGGKTYEKPVSRYGYLSLNYIPSLNREEKNKILLSENEQRRVEQERLRDDVQMNVLESQAKEKDLAQKKKDARLKKEMDKIQKEFDAKRKKEEEVKIAAAKARLAAIEAEREKKEQATLSEGIFSADGKEIVVPDKEPTTSPKPTTTSSDKPEEPGTSTKPTTGSPSKTDTKDEETSDKAQQVIKFAEKFLGTPYVFGAAPGRTSAFDCSSFTQYVMKNFGIDLPRTAGTQVQHGKTVAKSDLRAGDLVFFQTYKPGASHVVIYIGNGKFIGAQSTSGVSYANINEPYWSARYLTAKRYY